MDSEAPPGPKPGDAPWLTPYLTVSHVENSIDFYKRAFGFESHFAMPDSQGLIQYADMHYHGQLLLMMGPEGAEGSAALAPATSGTPAPVRLYVYCEDVDALHARAVANGAESLSDPEQMFWGDRVCRLRDPDGYTWAFATRVGDFTPANVPG